MLRQGELASGIYAQAKGIGKKLERAVGSGTPDDKPPDKRREQQRAQHHSREQQRVKFVGFVERDGGFDERRINGWQHGSTIAPGGVSHIIPSVRGFMYLIGTTYTA